LAAAVLSQKRKLAQQYHWLTDDTMHISGVTVSPLHYAVFTGPLHILLVPMSHSNNTELITTPYALGYCWILLKKHLMQVTINVNFLGFLSLTKGMLYVTFL
jgi:hypothetical protein